MTLAAAQVIDALAARVAAAALFVGKTYTDRAWPLDASELPAARVLALDEDIDLATVHAPSIQLHELQIVAELRVSAVSGLDDAMHAAAAQVLTSVGSSLARAAFAAAGIKTFKTRRISRRMEAQGQAAIGAIDITFIAQFNTRSDAPETILGATP